MILESWRMEYYEERPLCALLLCDASEYAVAQTTLIDVAMRPQTPHRSPRQAFGGKKSANAPVRQLNQDPKSLILRFLPNKNSQAY